MNRVGEGGRGESVWLGFFLYEALNRFHVLPRDRSDLLFAKRCVERAGRLRAALDDEAWDAAWYRPEWFANGAPRGATASDETTIRSSARGVRKAGGSKV